MLLIVMKMAGPIAAGKVGLASAVQAAACGVRHGLLVS